MSEQNNRNEIFSKKVLAGKRTYFFDVKTTRGNEYYLSITESKRRQGDDGSPFYEKHKIFLYRDDFEKFSEALTETLDRINDMSGGPAPAREAYTHTEEESHPEPRKTETPSSPTSSFTDVSFDDLP